MTEFINVDGRLLHPDMMAMMEARANAGPVDTIEQQRAAWSKYAAALSKPHPADMKVEDRTLALAHGKVTVRVYTPANAPANAAGVIYSHGGGFMKGDLDSSDNFAWGLADRIAAIVISVDYRLTPEHPFPAAFDDVYGVVCHVAENPTDFGVDAGRLAVCGDSAGGSLSAAVSLAARDRNGPVIAAQSLIYPVTGCERVGGSYEANAEAPGLTTSAMGTYNEMYMTTEADRQNAYARPILAGDFTNLPPAYIHTAQYDPILDDGINYAKKLIDAGSDVTYRCAIGMIHGFLRARAMGPGGKAEFDSVANWLELKLRKD